MRRTSEGRLTPSCPRRELGQTLFLLGKGQKPQSVASQNQADYVSVLDRSHLGILKHEMLQTFPGCLFPELCFCVFPEVFDSMLEWRLVQKSLDPHCNRSGGAFSFTGHGEIWY